MAERDEQPTTASIAEAARDEDAPTTRERTETGGGDLEPLLGQDEAGQFRDRWQSIQARFVDEPRTSVEQADALVAELMQRLSQTFADERKQLEQEWSGDGDVDTETHRVAVQRYRSFFERLLSA